MLLCRTTAVNSAVRSKSETLKKKSWLNRVKFKKNKSNGQESDYSDSESATSTLQVEELGYLI